jgi:hypothetical protein
VERRPDRLWAEFYGVAANIARQAGALLKESQD